MLFSKKLNTVIYTLGFLIVDYIRIKAKNYIDGFKILLNHIKGRSA